MTSCPAPALSRSVLLRVEGRGGGDEGKKPTAACARRAGLRLDGSGQGVSGEGG